MSLTLILTRHAKSGWGDATLSDRDRPLNKRGERDAPLMGRWLADRGHLPDAALVSPAVRTRETWGLVSGAFTGEVPVTYLDRLYHAGAAMILDAVRRAEGNSLMVIGHNPGMGEAATRIVNAPPRHGRFADYPTCATLVCRFRVEAWSEVGWGRGAVLDFATPHDL